jgi:NAD(P)-dependent dehydrogenase (short-subunit alcohol dehydrogenase family)
MSKFVITGSQSGMGLAIKEHLQSQDHAIIGVDLPGKGAEVDADLSTAEGRKAAVQAVIESSQGQLDGVLANAGVDVDKPELTFGVNYFGVVELLEGLQPLLAASAPSAAVVNISNSISITPGIPTEPADALLAGDLGRAIDLMKGQERWSYQTSKFAIARWLRRQAASDGWAGSGIRLNAICPGPVLTPLLEHDLADPVKGPPIRGLPRPLGEFTSCEQVAHLVEFLLSARARFLVGQLIMIDGGIETSFRAEHHPSVWKRGAEV